MASSKLSKDGTGEKCVGTYDAERFLTEKEASTIDWNEGIRILLIGKTGEGKSATGNTMMGQKWFKSDSSCKSVTQEGKSGRMKWKDKHIKIVDTPGFFDNRKSDEDLKLEIIKCMTLILPGPHIIMYVIRIGRYTNEDIAVADKFLKILDKNPYKHVIIVLTGRDDLDFHDKTTKSYLKNVPPEFKSFSKKCSQRYIFVDNRSKDSKFEWIQIYSEIEKLFLGNKRSFYTNKLLQKLNEAFGGMIAKRALVDTTVTIEEIIAALEKEVENERGILYSLLTNASVGAASCGIFSAIFGLTVPVIGAGAVIGAGGAVVGVGASAIGAYAYKKNEIRMVLIGRTGSGISVSGNSILKQVCFRSDSSVSSVTKTCCIGITERNGKVVKVVDTPGLFGNSMIVDKIKLEILNCFTLISPGPHVIVYVLRIGRFTNEEIQGIERFLHMFGGNPLQYTIILFTGVDDLEWNQLQVSNKEYLNDVPITLKKLIDGCSGRCVFFNNRLSNSENPNIQLDNFFMEVDKMLKKNQDNGKPYYTDNLSTQIGEDVSVCAEKSDEANCRYPYLPQVAGGTGIVIATTGVVFLGSTSLLVLPVVGLGIGIGLKYFKYSKKPNDKLSKVLEEIKEDSNIQCTLS